MPIFKYLKVVISFIIFIMLAIPLNKEHTIIIQPVDSTSLICLAENIYHEARGESPEGKKAVAFVTLNRVNDTQFPDNVCDVVEQKRVGICQFSWYCGKEKNKVLSINDKHYIESMNTAQYVLMNYDSLVDLTDGALFYHAEYVSLKKIGVGGLEKTVKIGHHIFYKLKNRNENARKTKFADDQRKRDTVNFSSYGRN